MPKEEHACIKMSRRFRQLQNSWGGSLLLSACLCVSQPGVSQNLLQYQECVFRVSSACVFPKSDWWYLTRPVTVCTSCFCISCLVFCNTHTPRYKHAHTPGCLAILFSHLLWLRLAGTAWLTALGLSGYPWLQPRGLCRGTQTCQHSLNPETGDGWPGATSAPSSVLCSSLLLLFTLYPRPSS